nr:PREDICTED: 28S ribosomal protein S16, mitochondrial [Odobenus rosmarus divergens]
MGSVGAGKRKGRGERSLRFLHRGARAWVGGVVRSAVSQCGLLRVLPPPPPAGGSALGGAASGTQASAQAGCTMVRLTTVLCRAYRGGHLTIRLALSGCTNRPFYRIVAAHNKCPRDGRFVEQLGSYDPLPNSHGEKIVALNLDRIRHWIGCGAHLSKPVEKLLGLSGFFPLHPMMITNAERLRRKRAREALLASQKTDTEATETKMS